MWRLVLRPNVGARLGRAGSVATLCLCLSGVVGCGASSRTTSAAATGGGFLALYCPSSAQFTPEQRALIASVWGVDTSLCAATDATWKTVVRSLRRLTPAQRARLDRLARTDSARAGNPQADAALQITEGILAGAALRAVPAPPPVKVKPLPATLGPRPPNPLLTSLVAAAVDPPADPPCQPPPQGKQEQSGRGLSIVQASTVALLRHADVRGVLLAVAHELANERLCDRLEKLIEELRRAVKLIKDPHLIDGLVAAQARAEGHPKVPPAATQPYEALRTRALRAYILSAQLTEVEQQSGGDAAARATALELKLEEPRRTGDSAILDEQINAERTIAAEEGR